MTIREGNITRSTHVMVPELLSNHRVLKPKFVNISNSLLIDGDYPSELEIRPLGKFQGYWKYWDVLNIQEKPNQFNFDPLFFKPSNKKRSKSPFNGFRFRLPKSTFLRYKISDIKITPRILYYPFGMFVTRIKVYFKFKHEVSLEHFIWFVKSVYEEIEPDWSITPPGKHHKYDYPSCYGEWHHKDNTVFHSINKRILDEIFKSSVPDHHNGYLGSLRPYPIIYLYHDENLNDREIAQLVELDTSNLNDQHVQRINQSNFGRLSNDTIIINKNISLIHTPCFSNCSPDNRRWKRIHLQNSIHLGTDFSNLENKHHGTITSYLNENLDSFVKGTFLTEPLQAKYLIMLDELMNMGRNLIDRRKEAYLKSETKNDHLRETLKHFTQAATNHDPYLKSKLTDITSLFTIWQGIFE